jgi:predicted site-specific integrase-resolvase
MYLLVKEAAIKLGVSRQWVNTLINKGIVKTTVLVGRRVIVEDREFKAMCKARKNNATGR